MHRAIDAAHHGQYLDLTAKSDDLPRQELADLSMDIARLKTGSITGLALSLGAVLGWGDASTNKSGLSCRL